MIYPLLLIFCIYYNVRSNCSMVFDGKIGESVSRPPLNNSILCRPSQPHWAGPWSFGWPQRQTRGRIWLPFHSCCKATSYCPIFPLWSEGDVHTDPYVVLSLEVVLLVVQVITSSIGHFNILDIHKVPEAPISDALTSPKAMCTSQHCMLSGYTTPFANSALRQYALANTFCAFQLFHTIFQLCPKAICTSQHSAGITLFVHNGTESLLCLTNSKALLIPQPNLSVLNALYFGTTTLTRILASYLYFMVKGIFYNIHIAILSWASFPYSLLCITFKKTC